MKADVADTSWPLDSSSAHNPSWVSGGVTPWPWALPSRRLTYTTPGLKRCIYRLEGEHPTGAGHGCAVGGAGAGEGIVRVGLCRAS
jgi:hypothetical protein